MAHVPDLVQLSNEKKQAKPNLKCSMHRIYRSFLLKSDTAMDLVVIDLVEHMWDQVKFPWGNGDVAFSQGIC